MVVVHILLEQFHDKYDEREFDPRFVYAHLFFRFKNCYNKPVHEIGETVPFLNIFTNLRVQFPC